MITIETGFDGLILIEPKIFDDHRGRFYESWSRERYQSVGIKEDFVQQDISISVKNVLRGLHFQGSQSQIVSIIKGVIFDVAVDMRPTSNTYLKHFSVILDDTSPRQLYMSAGFAHGFCVLSDEAVLHYDCSEYYRPSHEGGIIWNDPVLGIKWPITHPILSMKDQQFKGVSCL